MEVQDRLAAMEEDFNRVSADYDEIMSKFDREQEITGNVRQPDLLYTVIVFTILFIPRYFLFQNISTPVNYS